MYQLTSKKAWASVTAPPLFQTMESCQHLPRSRNGRSTRWSESLGCDRHTKNDTVVAYGRPCSKPTKSGSARSAPSAATRC